MEMAAVKVQWPIRRDLLPGGLNINMPLWCTARSTLMTPATTVESVPFQTSRRVHASPLDLSSRSPVPEPQDNLARNQNTNTLVQPEIYYRKKMVRRDLCRIKASSARWTRCQRRRISLADGNRCRYVFEGTCVSPTTGCRPEELRSVERSKADS